ncbi:MAG TPA: response regulator [Spongiibacteraceae bacterium]
MTGTLSLILNVDDSDGARYAKTRTLKLAGFDVIEASTGWDALAQVKEKTPDLVLLDMKLPDLNGFEVCRRIKSDPVTASVLVLQTSASLIDSFDKVRGLEGGADNYLVAPVEPQELVANVRALLRLRDVQRELLENEERFRQLAENIGDVFWIFDPKVKQLLYVSPAYAVLWGRSPERLYAHHLAWLESVHPADKQRVSAAFDALFDFQSYEQEYRLLMPDGEERWIRDRGFCVQNETGVNYRVARISQDITAQKKAENALRMAAVRKDEFLATLAHELRNPLAPMRTAIELMRMTDHNGATGLNEIETATIQFDSREIISRQIDHLVRLVDDLLDVSRITQGKLSLQKSRITLRKIIDAAMETNNAFLQSREHALLLDIPEDDVWIDGDSVRLAQVVGNLLHNAGKYTPNGGTIQLSATVDGGRLQIIIEDNGIGIAPGQIGHIFELFAQAGRLETRAPEGLGVGLSLVKKLVELHNGSVSVSSPGLGFGSRFVVDLPLAHRGDKPARQTAKARVKGNRNSLRILLVDDSVDATTTLGLLLTQMGHQIAIANEGRTALELAPQFQPQLVFLDIGLPGMNGYEVARAMRRLPALENTQLIALTGYGQARDRELSEAAGFTTHLIKPLDIGALTHLLSSYREQARVH